MPHFDLKLLVILPIIMISTPVNAQNYKVTCNFNSGNNDKPSNSIVDRDCFVSTLRSTDGKEQYNLEWSDKVTTTIKVIERPQSKGRSWQGEGVGLVDGYSAKITKFADGGICAKVIKSGNTICFR